MGLAVLLAFSPAALEAADSLFSNPVIVRSKNFELRENDLQDAFIALKAARAAIRQPVPPNMDGVVREQLLDKLIATKLILARATSQDRDEGKQIADKLLAETKGRAPSEASYRRQLLAVGTTVEKYEADILEQAVVKAVLNRELKNKEVIAPAAIREYYEKNLNHFQEPEKARVAHILLPTREIPSGLPVSPEARLHQLNEAKRVQKRASDNPEDFDRLIAAFSKEPAGNEKRGEVVVVKGANTAPSAFEVAAFSLQPGHVSDVVESPFGFHIIKLLELIPPKTTPLEQVQDRIRDLLQEQGVQSKLDEYLAKIRQEAGVEVLPP